MWSSDDAMNLSLLVNCFWEMPFRSMLAFYYALKCMLPSSSTTTMQNRIANHLILFFMQDKSFKLNLNGIFKWALDLINCMTNSQKAKEVFCVILHAHEYMVCVQYTSHAIMLPNLCSLILCSLLSTQISIMFSNLCSPPPPPSKIGYLVVRNSNLHNNERLKFLFLNLNLQSPKQSLL